MLGFVSSRLNAGSYHLISNSPTKSILSNSQHSTPQRTIGSDHPLNQQQSKLPMSSPNKGYMMLPYRKINDSPTHQLIQIQHSNLDNYCREYLLKKFTPSLVIRSTFCALNFLLFVVSPFIAFSKALNYFQFFFLVERKTFRLFLNGKKTETFFDRCAFLIKFTS